MKAGALRHEVVVQRRVEASPSQNSIGEIDAPWTDYLTVFAEWRTLSGAELFAAQQHNPRIRGVWKIRWDDRVTSAMRIKDGSRYWEILYVPPYDKRGKQWDMELESAEVVDG